MQQTIELLKRLQGSDSDSTIGAKLGVGKTTISMARKAGRLSPTLAAKIAEILGENATFWTAVAAAEQQVEPTRSALMAVIMSAENEWRARRDSNPRPLASEANCHRTFRRTAKYLRQKARENRAFFRPGWPGQASRVYTLHPNALRAAS